MFGWGKKKSNEAAPRDAKKDADGPVIAALLHEDELSVEDLKKEVEGATFFGARPTDVKINRGMLAFDLDGAIVAVAPMGAPYPWRDLEGPCHTSWMWPPGKSAMDVKPHKTHSLVTMVRGGGDRITRRIRLTQLTALGAAQPGVLGVYWPEATLVHYPPIFIDMAKELSPKGPPLYLWVDFRVQKNNDGTCRLFTTGMAPLGQLEIEIPSLAMKPGELQQWAINIAYNALENGHKMHDGNTMGMSENDRSIVIRIGKSMFKERGTVMRFEKA